MSRKAFEEWCALISDCDYREGAWDAWQYREAQHKKELAALQARVKELEGVLGNIGRILDDEHSLNEQEDECPYCYANELAKTYFHATSPDQALQRALLDARIDEQKNHCGDMNRWIELRKQRAELGD